MTDSTSVIEGITFKKLQIQMLNMYHKRQKEFFITSIECEIRPEGILQVVQNIIITQCNKWRVALCVVHSLPFCTCFWKMTWSDWKLLLHQRRLLFWLGNQHDVILVFGHIGDVRWMLSMIVTNWISMNTYAHPVVALYSGAIIN